MALKTSEQFPISTSCWLGIAAAPFLVGLLAAKSGAQALIELGQASEEVFRGDRLPILKFPEPTSDSQNTEQE